VEVDVKESLEVAASPTKANTDVDTEVIAAVEDIVATVEESEHENVEPQAKHLIKPLRKFVNLDGKRKNFEELKFEDYQPTAVMLSPGALSVSFSSSDDDNDDEEG
jgi:hypothetical protein